MGNPVEEISLLGLLRAVESSIMEESQKTDLLLPFVEEIDKALKEDNYRAAMYFIDELEEFMDLEFCN